MLSSLFADREEKPKERHEEISYQKFGIFRELLGGKSYEVVATVPLSLGECYPVSDIGDVLTEVNGTRNFLGGQKNLDLVTWRKIGNREESVKRYATGRILPLADGDILLLKDEGRMIGYKEINYGGIKDANGSQKI